jgi:hypothetical protein
MVIGERFAWGHLPKSGGDTTLELFRLFPDLVVSADPPDSNRKHTLFRARESDVAGKVLALNFRRLPDWLLSRAHHEAREGLYPDYQPQPMRSPHQIATCQFADGWLDYFTDGGRLSIDRWIRLEHLKEDFLRFVSEFTDITDDQRARVEQNSGSRVAAYDREVTHWFTDSQIRTMYEYNPRWRDLERELYREWPRLE